MKNIDEKQSQIIQLLDTHKPHPQDGADDYMFLRSHEWENVPSPLKTILCAAAMEFKYQDIWNISIKLEVVKMREHCSRNDTPASYLIETCKSSTPNGLIGIFA